MRDYSGDGYALQQMLDVKRWELSGKGELSKSEEREVASLLGLANAYVGKHGKQPEKNKIVGILHRFNCMCAKKGSRGFSRKKGLYDDGFMKSVQGFGDGFSLGQKPRKAKAVAGMLSAKDKAFMKQVSGMGGGSSAVKVRDGLRFSGGKSFDSWLFGGKKKPKARSKKRRVRKRG